MTVALSLQQIKNYKIVKQKIIELNIAKYYYRLHSMRFYFILTLFVKNITSFHSNYANVYN